MNKNKNDLRYADWYYDLSWTNGTYPSHNVIGPTLVTQRRHVSSSVSTPNYRELSRYRLPINPYTMEIEEIDAPMTNMTMVDDYGSYQAIHQFYINHTAMGASLSFAELPEVAVISKCTSKLLKGLNTAKANSAVSLIEGHKTGQLVARAATKIYSSIKALKSFNFVLAAQELGITRNSRVVKRLERKFSLVVRNGVQVRQNHLRRIYDPKTKYSSYVSESQIGTFVSSSWLELSYGWKPLLGDIYNSAEALANVMIEKSNTVRHYQSAVREETEKTYENRSMGETWLQLKKIKITTSVKIGVRYRIPEGGISPVHVFGLSNPLLVAWELVPFSFVADWFLPIGSALESLTATNGLEFVDGYQTAHTKREVTSKVFQEKPYTAGGKTRTWSGSASGKYLNFPFQRSSFMFFPPPQIPTFRDPRSLSHGASAIALLQSLFLKK